MWSPLSTHDSETTQRRIESAIANGAAATVQGIGAHAMKVVGQGRISYDHFLFDEEELSGVTFPQDNAKRTGPLMIDMSSPLLDSTMPPRASFAEHLDNDLNPQPWDWAFEEDVARRTGPALQ